mgnify:CR=1 FL=1
MSSTNFGKIILFRVEDLLPENNVNAYYPSLAPPGPFDLPFIKNFQLEAHNLNYTSGKDYRIIGKNYKLIDGALENTVYTTLIKPGEEGFPSFIKNPFVEFKKISTSENQIEKVKFKFTDDQLFREQYEFNLQDKMEFVKSMGQNEEFGAIITGFLNHNLSLSKPLMSNQDNPLLNKYGIGDSIKIKPVYNYYLKDYEQFYNSLPASFTSKALGGVVLSEEKSIPNFYYLITLLASPEIYSSITSNNASSGFGEPAPFTIEGILEGVLPDSSGFITSPVLGFQLSREILVYEQQSTRERNSVVVVTPSFYKALSNEIKTQKITHPFYNNIQIPITKGGTVFRDLFKKSKMYEQLQYRAGLQIKIINKAVQNGLDVSAITSQYNIFYTQAKETDDGLQVIYESSDGREDFNVPYSSEDTKPRIIEFNVSLNSDGENYNFKQPTSGDTTFINYKNYVSRKREISPITNGELNGSGVNFNLAKSNDALNAVDDFGITSPLTFYANNPESENDYIGSVIQNKANSILEYIFNKAKLSAAAVLNNIENYSEVLFFEVQKLDEDGNLIQTFILPNDPDIGDRVEYIDSQIKYKKTYVYKIYAHTISIGNKLIRGNADPETSTTPNIFAPIDFEYENYLDIKLLRIPYYNTEEYTKKDLIPTINMDSPPIPPNITFYPFKNVSNKIGFWFNVGLGEIKMKAFSQLLESDSDKALERAKDYQTIRLLQTLNGDITIEDSNDFKMLFKTDDFGGKIEIFRLTEKPESYSDFANNKISDVDVVGPRTLIDDIIPNQDYYYVFRHIDVHGLASNPTPVYHFKMITSDSTMESDSVRIGVEGLQPVLFNEIIYLNNNSYEDQKVEKSFKKYLLVEPTLAQTYLSFNNFENDVLNDDNSFNSAGEIKLRKEKLKIGRGSSDFVSVKGKKFKIRVTSKQTGRKIDLNVNFKNLSVIENYQE